MAYIQWPIEFLSGNVGFYIVDLGITRTVRYMIVVYTILKSRTRTYFYIRVP